MGLSRSSDFVQPRWCVAAKAVGFWTTSQIKEEWGEHKTHHLGPLLTHHLGSLLPYAQQELHYLYPARKTKPDSHWNEAGRWCQNSLLIYWSMWDCIRGWKWWTIAAEMSLAGISDILTLHLLLASTIVMGQTYLVVVAVTANNKRCPSC
jgi:hypothetical protein